ncbi:MAG: S-adenosylmethionine:tRNA ribosyltransferase-isomerase [Bacteroidales bacterium]|nr:S-adenosylmethionine:tRNA ribosyltransferase-isomerase [Bacteroidales bacterium]
MKAYQNININDYNYNLPDDRIAKYPLQERDHSNLLLKQQNHFSKDKFYNISKHIPPESLIIFNNTKVINARMHFTKETGAIIEIFCLEPVTPIDYTMALSANQSCTWKCLVGNSKKWKSGKLKKSIEIRHINTTISISRLNQLGNAFEILFEWDNENIHFSDILDNSGNIPIPPYLNRESEEEDKKRYQTVYSQPEGSVAAPTAGLHFTNRVFDDLSAKNIKTDFVTLHVGAGTFHPVKTDNAIEHEMHTEHFIISQQNIKNIIENFGNITVVGTTSVRTLESLFIVACKVWHNPQYSSNNFSINQWEAYDEHKINLKSIAPKIIENLYNWMQSNNYESLNCATQIMIVPGYKFVLTNRLITNFHQPKSTLLLLLAAFIGSQWKDAYKFALNNNFRFLSYGDSCFFEEDIFL